MDPYVGETVGRRRWWWAAAGVALAATIAGVGIGLRDGGGPATPAEHLAEVLAFVQEHRTARFEETSRTEIDVPDSFLDLPEAARMREHRSRTEGELDVSGSMRRRTEQGGHTIDAIHVGGFSYQRSTFEGETTVWSRYPSDDDEDWIGTFSRVIEREREEAAADGQTSTMSLLFTSEHGWPHELLTDAAAVGTVTSPGPGRLRIAYQQRSFLGDEEQALLDRIRDDQLRDQYDEERVLVVEHGAGGRLDVLRQERQNHTTVTRFRDWGLEVHIAAPPDTEVDVTPTIDEEGLLAMSPGPVLAPADLLAGWKLVSGRVSEHDEGGPSCTYATLTYGPGDDVLETAASVATVDGACEFLGAIGDPADGAPARFGNYDVFLHGNESFRMFSPFVRNPAASAAVRVPQGWVLVSTTEGEDVLARLVASLTPYDPASTPMASSTEKAPS